MVILTHREADAVPAFDRISAIYRRRLAVDLLVHHWLEQFHFAMRGHNDQRSFIIQRDLLRAFDRKSYVRCIRAWSHQKIMFQMSKGPVIDQVDTFVDVLELHFLEVSN